MNRRNFLGMMIGGVVKRAFRVDVLERMVRGYGLYNPDGNTWS